MLKRTCLVIILLLGILQAFAQPATKPVGEPVLLGNDTLFTLYAGQGLFTVKERTQVISKRLTDLTSRLDFNADSITIKNDTALCVISYKGELIMAVNNNDAALSELNRQQLATNFVSIIKKTLGNSIANNSVKQLLTDVLEAVAVIILLLILIWGVNRTFRWIKYRIFHSWDKRLAKLAEKGAPVNYAHRLLPVFINLLNILRLAIIVLMIYLALPVAFLIFPWTKPIATQLLSYVVDPLKRILFALLHYIPNLLTVLVIYLFTRYIIKLVKFIAVEISNGSFVIKNFYPEWAIPTYNIVRVLLYAFMFVVIFPYLPGSDSKVFQGVTVFLGILFSFGSSSAISNMVSGIVLTYMRPYKVGDRVKVGDVTGDVIEKNLLITRVRTIKNEDVTVPNATILAGATVNYTTSSKSLGLILNTSVTIGYDVPWQQVHDLLISAAISSEGVLSEPTPFVLQTGLNDFNVAYQLNAYTDKPQQMAVLYSRIHQNIQDKFNEAGVEIMSPHYSALRDGNTIQIPDGYKPTDYKKPGFNIEKD
ncbi:mechanosensitive ion channel [Mucilaginibacter gynuensis]|uniref:Mechanosensitive ion channel n=1 Tax=Mucilaginibacter gynuensis TaxID=1302236 RepID=A0ABP8H9R7_9SPHI